MRWASAVRWLLFLALILLCRSSGAQVAWVQHNGPDESVPPNAVVAGKSHGVRLYVCRARLADGIHPGESTGSTCVIPNMGKTQAFTEFEFATSSNYSWHHDQWEDAVIGGQQHAKSDLYVCRARVVQDSISHGFISGKAYRFGPHTNHCYVPFQGKELDFKDHFELLHSSSKSR